VREDEGVVDLPAAAFEALVSEALDELPAELTRAFTNVAVLVEDENPEDPDLLGLYEGTPVTERDGWYSGVLPDRVYVYRLPLLDMCEDLEELKEEVRITVVHELAHHSGIDDQRLHDLGWA
jgi:predicted Zn-dependent protease with MMP-like domain